MSSDRMRALLDDIGKVSDARLEQLRDGAGAPGLVVNPLGLRFANGARVLDVATGASGTVTRGWREADTSAEHFMVRLDDARLVPRAGAELEPHPTPKLPGL